MSVGKESIKRAASAGAKKTAAAKTAEADVKKTTEAKAATVKAAETKVSSAEKTAGTAKKTTSGTVSYTHLDVYKRQPGGYCENCYGGKFLYASPVSGDSN